MNRVLAVFVILALAVSFTGCRKDHVALGVSSQTAEKETLIPQLSRNSENCIESQTSFEWNQNALMKNIYTATPYSVSYSELIDTYLIACGLYFDDFNSPYLFPADVMVDYRETIEFFSPYKNHAFIQELKAYVDEENSNASMNVYVPLLQYAVSMKEKGECIGNIQSYVFQTNEEFYNFLAKLQQFYLDTQAAEFFEHSAIHKQLEQYIQNEIESVPVVTYFDAIEAYTGTKDQIFPESILHFSTCLSVYKSRNNATFHHISFNKQMFLLSFQSPIGINGDFSIQDMLDTTIHESLHPFINPGVEQQQDMIQALSSNKNPAKYTCSIYVNMPWNRITDEAIVRVVQARIYREIDQGNETTAKQLLNRQTCFANLNVMYDSLANYEIQRDKYPKIDDYLYVLIPLYLDGN